MMKEKGVKIDLIHIDPRHKLDYVRAAWRTFLLNFGPRRYHLIHAHYGYCGALARLQFRYPTIVTFHGSDLLHPREKILGRLVARTTQALIVMSVEMKRVSGRADAYIIPFGVDQQQFHPYPKSQARQDLGLSLEAKYVLFPWKPTRPEKRFVLAEAVVDRLRAEFPELILLAIWDRPRGVIARYMQSCDALLLTSVKEGSPVAVREALACGLPVISVDVGDVRQLVEDIPGCAICNSDPAALAERLARVLRDPPYTPFINGEDSHGTARAAEMVLGVYHSLVNGSRVGLSKP